MRRLACLLALGASVLTLPACRALSSVTPVGLVAAPFYRANLLPAALVQRDVPYRDTGDPKHTLDLYRPAPGTPRPAPTLVFVHGGGWNSGDKALRLDGSDVYANVGRYFAARGVLTAVVNYRLLPSVTWEAQAKDVADAVAWTMAHAGENGGTPGRTFLLGHSAGAQIAARLAVDPAWLAEAGASASNVCGVVSVSGAGFDLTHVGSIRDDYHYFATRFAPPGAPVRARMTSMADTWQRTASPALAARREAPPFRFIVLRGEAASFRQQAERMRGALVAAGAPAPAPVLEVPGGPHALGAVLMSRADLGIAPEALRFVRETPCR